MTRDGLTNLILFNVFTQLTITGRFAAAKRFISIKLLIDQSRVKISLDEW
jgi:hypothetical protein